MENGIRIRSTGQVITDYEYRCLHPNVSFADGFVPDGGFLTPGDRIVSAAPPAVTLYERAVRVGAEQVGAEWRVTWQIVPALPPESVPMLNARLALIEEGHMEAVSAILAASPGVDGEKARTFFEFAQNVRRDHWVVEALRAALGLTTEQIDRLFILAATLD